MNYVFLGKRENPTILFLHGWGGSINSFLGFAQFFSVIGYSCLVVDFPGFGKSADPPFAFGVKDYADGVVSLLNDLGINSAIIVGHSFGGRVAIKLARNYPSRVLKLVLVDSAGIKPRFSLTKELKIKKYKFIKGLAKVGIVKKERLANYGSSDYTKLNKVMKASFIKIVNEDLKKDAAKIATKSLIVWGRRDKETPLYMAKKLHKAIKSSRLIIYEGGHYSYLDESDRFVDDLYAFILN